MSENLLSQSWWFKRWYGKPGELLWLLPLEWLFRGLAAARKGCFQYRIFRGWRAPVPVIVVGNITVGGVGKTPLVVFLVEYLCGQGYTPGVVSRGYGSNPGRYPYRLTKHSTASQAGDEPLLIFKRTACPCVIGPNRPAAVKKLLAESECDIVISDDGLQHYALERDIELVIVDAERLFGNTHCLPVGPMREPITRLQEADFVIRNGGSDAHDMNILPGNWINLASGKQQAMLPLQEGMSVNAVCGIGNPQRFFSTLASMGLSFEPHSFADHYPFTAADLDYRQEGSDDQGLVLMTEKDAVKCLSFATENMWYLSIDAVITHTLCAELLAKIKLKSIVLT
jgi:tetraacyldisaccharide 4'-kinase